MAEQENKIDASLTATTSRTAEGRGFKSNRPSPLTFVNDDGEAKSRVLLCLFWFAGKQGVADAGGNDSDEFLRRPQRAHVVV